MISLLVTQEIITDPFVPAFGFGQGEIDTLSGGEGIDTFVLGQDDQVFYVGQGINDYALITDFNLGEDIIQLATNPTGSVNVSEVGDAGQSLFNAQVIPGGSGTLDSITGTISNSNDVDLFQITLTDGGTFSATTVGGANFDTQLFLFDDSGVLVRQNDDSSGTLQSTISDSPFDPLAPGTYFLGISSFNNDPVGIPPTFPGGGFSSGDYTIELTGVESAPPTFSIGASPVGLPAGTGIFFGDDLIAILQDLSIFSPTLSGGSFAFA
ncbi:MULTISPECIES: DVUA0089 family protein [unclassified Coleofasciculus]|uniref:DVUA0089 family protein n=1 Tax=unclassified Coleofasciculus TaxID=2692782 RepID=UPI001880481C|nr:MULTISPECIES: DVUA0089 family protein [unclassified Coleofasciculus]MBE9127743.1 PPC domain-containing protein [Coleofasciculus sp. LEGE 07081]MBE9150711.1 PPC domain-containing protein [Coleofasciculus sp. LEGE 07092]